MTHLLEEPLRVYLASRMPQAHGVRVSGIARIPGGASRETYRFVAQWSEAGQEYRRHLILRRDPPASLIDTDRRTEFAAYRAFHGSDVPVPEMLWLEEAGSPLEHPFFIAEEIRGFQAGPGLLFTPPYLESLPRLGRRKYEILGRIAAADPARLGLCDVMETPDPQSCWRRELDHWEGIIDADAVRPLPVVRAAIRWLRRNPPRPAQRISVVHGDYRTGNFLYDDRGGIHGILDWEMAHLGDPLEDLGWSLNPVWSFGRGLAGGLISREEAILSWEAASGLHAEPAELHWWELFNCVKGQAIWVSSAHAWIGGANREPILVYPSWAMQNAQDRAILQLMGRL